jgi:phenylalanyl-tRNA synthetase alpha chain
MMDRQNSFSNIPLSIKNKIDRKLHNLDNHPISIIKNHIYKYFDKFMKYDNLDPVVTVENNFDLLLINKSHPSRSKSDTYYVNENEVLRTHTSSHQNDLLSSGQTSFLVTGDVYRKDEIDRCHYPIFHQMEGVCISTNPKSELIETLTGLVKYLFPNREFRVSDDYFPFTEPSFEIEVDFDGKWIEILGCGVVHTHIMNHNNLSDKKAWAFGLGLDRLAMILFNIPDIRYLWSTDKNFLSQFKENCLTQFVPYSNLETTTRDISFWIPGNSSKLWTDENHFYEILREISELICNVECCDTYDDTKKDRYSKCYRINFSPLYCMNNPSELHMEANSSMKLLAEKIQHFVEIR